MEVELRPGETFENLLKRFKKIVQREGILDAVEDRKKFGAKPSVRRKFKKVRALARLRKLEKRAAYLRR